MIFTEPTYKLGVYNDEKSSLRILYRRGTNDMKIIEEVVIKSVYFKKLAKGCMIGKDRARVWLDLGMHIGVFSSIAVLLGCKVYGFEPDQSNYKLAKENVAYNMCVGGEVHTYPWAVVPKAMMNKEKTCTFFHSVRPSNCARHTVLSTYPQKTERKSSKVRSVTFEKILAQYPLVEGVKMDIEGAVWILEEQT